MCRKDNNLNKKKSDFLFSKMFELLNRMKGNSINDCDIFKFIIYPGGQPL